MKNNNLVSWVGSTFGVVFTAIQTNEVFQIISLVLTILSILVSLAFTIFKWYKSAKEDGEITPDEIKEILEEGGETANQIIDVINDYNDKKEGNKNG
jgi:hypothetical protein